MMKKLVAGAAFAAAAVLSVAFLLQPRPTETASKPLRLSYACADSVALSAAFAPDFQTVRIALSDQTIEMTQAMAASGIRYVGGAYTFWSKGDEAFVMKDEDIIIKDCKRN